MGKTTQEQRDYERMKHSAPAARAKRRADAWLLTQPDHELFTFDSLAETIRLGAETGVCGQQRTERRTLPHPPWFFDVPYTADEVDALDAIDTSRIDEVLKKQMRRNSLRRDYKTKVDEFLLDELESDCK